MAVDRILLSVSPGETRIAELSEGQLVGLSYDRAGQRSLVGDIIAGQVESVIHHLQAAFVDIGEERSGYLSLPDARPYEAKKGDVIGDYVIEGDSVLVQVTRDPEDSKGAKLTMKPVLTGRDLIYTPGRPEISLSRRIKDKAERDRLSKALAGRDTSRGGLILRTAAQEAEAEDLIREADRLEASWADICEAYAAARAPKMLQQEAEPALRILRDIGGAELNAVVTDDSNSYNALRGFIATEMPDITDLVHLYRGKAPLFRSEGIEEMIEATLEPLVPLPSGGNIRINETDALVVVDVNSAGARGGGRDQMIRNVNCEAAIVFGHQIRLRNLSGLIIIDFVSMRITDHQEVVLETLRRAVADDPQQPFVGGFTRFGLVEMTRRRKGLSLSELLCDGPTTPQKSAITTGLEVLRRVLEKAHAEPAAQFTIEVAASTKRALETRLASALAKTSDQLGGGLALVETEALKQDTFIIRRGTEAARD